MTAATPPTMPRTMPRTMTVIETSAPGGPEKLVAASRPVDRPGPGEVLIKVAAAGVNRPDILQRQGDYPPPKGVSDILGLEVAGAVVEAAPDVTQYPPGAEVCALVAGGGYAQYCVAPAAQCLPVPAGLTILEAASLPEAYFTVWANLVDRVGLKQGESLLIHGGSSGIGTAAIQTARLLGARVFATAGTAEKCAACESLGAEKAINYTHEDFVEAVKELTGGKGVDVILDMVGGDYIPRNISLLATEGRLVNIAYQKGAKAEVNFLPVMLKRLTLTGATLRIRSVEYKGAVAKALGERVWPHMESGRIRPVIHATFPLAQAGEAHALMESGAHIGKIMLQVAAP